MARSFSKLVRVRVLVLVLVPGRVLVPGLGLAFALSGCSGNAPPEWSDAPASVHLGEGETLALPLTLADADGDVITPTVALGSGASDALEVQLSDGASSFTIHAAFDAASRVTAPATVTVTLSDDRGATRSYPLTVTVDPIAWKTPTQWSGASGPIAREHGTFLFDEASHVALLIGGSGYKPQSTALADFWKIDLASGVWSAVTPTGDVPPPLASSRAVQMPGTTTAYIFGGYTGDGSVDTAELYRVDFGGGQLAFTKLAQTQAPPSRSLHGFGYDPTSQHFAVFGGYSQASGTVLSDTWTMQLSASGDTASWTKLTTPGPTPRYGFFYGTDAATGRFFVFSGAQNPSSSDPIHAAQDTWALDLRADAPTWSRILTGTEAGSPPGRRNGCFVVDPRGPSLWVFGGTSDGMTTQPGLFALDMRPGHEGFSAIARPSEPPLRSSGFGFFDSVAGSVVCGFGNSSSGAYTDLAAIGP